MTRRKIEWHPVLGRLLRRRVEGYYELLTNVSVGDLPRQADIMLLRRTTNRELPVDEDSLPLHVLGVEPLKQQVAVG